MRVAVLALAMLASGCTLVEPPGPRDVEGRTDGYAPTATYLKVFVLTPEGKVVWVDFDRRDWHVAQIADRLDRHAVKYLAVAGQEREIPGEVVVLDVRDPADLASLKYEAMGATAQQRAMYDLEYEDLLARFAATPGPAPAGPAAPAVPTLG